MHPALCATCQCGSEFVTVISKTNQLSQVDGIPVAVQNWLIPTVQRILSSHSQFETLRLRKGNVARRCAKVNSAAQGEQFSPSHTSIYMTGPPWANGPGSSQQWAETGNYITIGTPHSWLENQDGSLSKPADGQMALDAPRPEPLLASWVGTGSAVLQGSPRCGRGACPGAEAAGCARNDRVIVPSAAMS